ncbi:hypothetical protein FE257_010381 [Aspergillus nanangensis]|uniref:Peptidase metallopeptidase domain-containing protein n=1 Tax=Aspergillus nanangensis TaxID=2582783 RepID=A0AAD4CK62_ASPNN|nr:hypothetical protein FE257_010381 [Aspergillus nanangensis]
MCNVSMVCKMKAMRVDLSMAMILAILLSLLLSSVDAGHPKWEPSVSNVKWVHQDVFKTRFHRWLNSRIEYCFDTEETKGILGPSVENGLEYWHHAGLSEEFQMIEIERQACLGRSRPTSLVISLSQDGSISSTIGVDPNDPAEMILANPAQLSPERIIPIVAHEIGHVFGLYHEHQDPRFWDSGNQGPFIFYCDRLRGYQEILQRLGFIGVWGKDGVCTNSRAAGREGFSSSNFLPEPPEMTVSSNGWHANDGDVDWKSLMLYEGSAFCANRNEPALVRRSTGEPTPLNLAPSEGDIEGLNHMYYASRDTTFGEILMVYHESRWNHLFMRHVQRNN